VLDLDLEKDSHGRALFIAAMNAVMKKLKLTSNTVHCKSEDRKNAPRVYFIY
jgi:hypothetical protein